MLHFESDYLEGAHPKILQKLEETNGEQTSGYGFDPYCESAKEKIREACACPDAEIWFLPGGTQANSVVLDALLATWQAAVAASTGHICDHEAGAVEAHGHKVYTLPQKSGKLVPEALEHFLADFAGNENRDHMASPGAAYISHPSEYGTIYTAEELRKLHRICGAYHIPLFLDGARLGYGLAVRTTDVTLPLLAECCDVFTIGGTKVGALLGEAIVIPKKGSVPHFFTVMKQHGAVLAKARLLGIQFDVLFTDGLYFSIARHAVELADRLEAGLKGKGCRIYIDSPTNQKFLVLEDRKLEALKPYARFGFWEKYDGSHTVVRLATSWATREEDVEALLRLF